MHTGRRAVVDLDVPRGGARGSKGVSGEHDIGVLTALTPHLCNVIS